ncbi:MAG: hypothetical protein Q8O00_01120, partial [Holophaga sp.]|nr:hypothetical protein [Holophaga sp.]
DNAGSTIQRLRWRLRMRSGYAPLQSKIPKRYTEVVTWKGPINAEFLETLRHAYATKLMELGQEETE